MVIVAGIRSVSNLGLGAAHLINNAGNDAIIRRLVTTIDWGVVVKKTTSLLHMLSVHAIVKFKFGYDVKV